MLAQNVHAPGIKFMPLKGKGSKATQVSRKTLPAALTAYLPQRNSVIDWFYRAHSILQFSKSTLFLGIALLDKLLTLQMPLADQKLQLVGAAILLLVTKFNEVYPVSLRKLNALSSIDQSAEKYTEVQAQILETVGFALSPEDPIYQELAQTEYKLGTQSQDIIKLAVLNPSISFKFGSPALLAALQSFFTGWSERKNDSKISSESAELTRELEKLRLGSSPSVRRMVSPSRA